MSLSSLTAPQQIVAGFDLECVPVDDQFVTADDAPVENLFAERLAAQPRSLGIEPAL